MPPCNRWSKVKLVRRAGRGGPCVAGGRVIRQRNLRAWHKLNAALRRGVVQLPWVRNASVFVNEYPKSGGTWLTLMLAELLGYPFARNRLPYLSSTQIFHGHHPRPATLPGIAKVLLWRDGRDVMVSLYYHCLFYNDRGNRVAVDRCRAGVPFTDYVDIRRNLPAFMAFIQSGRGVPAYGWSAFVENWIGCRECVHTSYEALFDDTAGALSRVVEGLGKPVDAGAVSAVAERHRMKRKPASDSTPEATDARVPFIRQGGYGGWRQHFSREAAEVFRDLHGDALVEAGYEPDHDWVQQVA